MEPESSLLHLQVPTICLYPELDQSNPCPHPASWRSILILYSHLRVGLPNDLSLSLSLRFSIQNPVRTSVRFHTCYVPCPLYSSQFEPFHSFTGAVITLHSVTSSCVLIPRHDLLLSFITTFSRISLLADSNASFFIVLLFRPLY
jgi:hypothetical protein